MKSPDQVGQIKPTTFAELEIKKEVSASELTDILRDYVESGAAISDRAVLSIIRRTELNSDERATIKQLAQKGADLQTANQESKAAKEYQTVVDQIDSVSASPER